MGGMNVCNRESDFECSACNGGVVSNHGFEYLIREDLSVFSSAIFDDCSTGGVGSKLWMLAPITHG